MNKLRIATLMLLALSLAVPTVAFAQDEGAEHGRQRYLGEITKVVPGQGTFELLTRAGREIDFQTDDRTRFRSPDGSVEDIHDLKKGMKALVVAVQTDEGLLAVLVAAGFPEDLPEGIRVAGEIVSVDPGSGSFELKTRQGEILAFTTGERTRYRGEGIDSLEDLEPGMHALVLGVEQEDGLPLALLVAAGEPKERPERMRSVGEVTGVVPGQGTFTLQTRGSQELEFQTSDRTQFRSPNGEVQDIHDLKKGMKAVVVYVQQEDGSLLALLVAAAHPEDLPDRPGVDMRAAGRIVELGDRTFTLQKRDGSQLTFSVTDETIFKGVSGFGDLEIGMLAAAGALESGGSLQAVWVAARPAPDVPPRDGSSDRPQRPDQVPAEPSSTLDA